MPDYRIKIPNEKRRTYQLVNLIILLVNLIQFITRTRSHTWHTLEH